MSRRTLSMQYQVQFLGASTQVIGELFRRAERRRSSLVADTDWPPHAVSIRVLDADRHGADIDWPAHDISIRFLYADWRAHFPGVDVWLGSFGESQCLIRQFALNWRRRR